MNIKNKLQSLIAGIDGSEISVCKNPELGDYTVSTFKCADKKDEIIEKLIHPLIAEVKVVGPYINIFLDEKEAFEQVVKNGDVSALNKIGKGKTVCIDFSSINIAKMMHIGHLGTTIIGNSLSKIFSSLGYKVIRINYLGDYGTQFGTIIYGAKKYGCDLTSLEEINAMYVRMNAECTLGSEAYEAAKKESALIEQGNKENVAMYNQIHKTTLDYAKPIYEDLGVSFDSWEGEARAAKDVEKAKKVLKDHNLLIEKDGALRINLEEYGLGTPAVFRSDGASVYIARDIAEIIYRKEKYNYDKIVYVVAVEQNLNFKQLFKTMELIDKDKYKELIHVGYGMVRLASGSLSTRKGNVVLLKDIIETAKIKAREKSKNIEVADQVAIGAVLFSTLQAARLNNITFDYNKILEFEGETAPYIQYTNARINSILAKNEKEVPCNDFSNVKPLVKLIDSFANTIGEAASDCEPCYISRLLLDICSEFNKFYVANKISGNAERIELCKAVQKVLQKGLELLGIPAPKSM